MLSDEQLAALRQRSEDIAELRVDHVPERYIQFEAAFRGESEAFRVYGEPNLPEGTSRLDGVRKMTQLAYFDPVFEQCVKTPAIVDAIQDLLACEDIKLYTDQLMMKPRFNGTVTDWHQDSVAWPSFFPQDHVSCWVALDNGEAAALLLCAFTCWLRSNKRAVPACSVFRQRLHDRAAAVLQMGPR